MNNITLIGINGLLHSGKDTFGKAIQFVKAKEKVKEPSTLKALFKQGIGDGYNYDVMSGWQIKKFAKKLKKIASILTGFDEEKFEDQKFKDMILPRQWDLNGQPRTVREFLLDLGTEAIRDHVHPNTWVNALFSEYNDGDQWIITDCRFRNEAEAIKERGGIVVKVVRPGLSDETGHVSETDLMNWNFDYIVDNDGSLNDLVGKADEMLNVLSYNMSETF